jgi:hypothetical protein
MATVTLRLQRSDAPGDEERLIAYMCDWPDCPNIAVQVIGVVRELGMPCAMCEEHAQMVKGGRSPQA